MKVENGDEDICFIWKKENLTDDSFGVTEG
jgi:hypothetical protein